MLDSGKELNLQTGYVRDSQRQSTSQVCAVYDCIERPNPGFTKVKRIERCYKENNDTACELKGRTAASETNS
jgi:hypothetical protein